MSKTIDKSPTNTEHDHVYDYPACCLTWLPVLLYLLCNTRFIQTQIGCHPQLNQTNTRKSIQRIRNNTSDETIPSHSYFIQQFRTTLDMSNSKLFFFFTNVLVTWIHKKYFSKKKLECNVYSTRKSTRSFQWRTEFSKSHTSCTYFFSSILSI